MRQYAVYHDKEAAPWQDMCVGRRYEILDTRTPLGGVPWYKIRCNAGKLTKWISSTCFESLFNGNVPAKAVPQKETMGVTELIARFLEDVAREEDAERADFPSLGMVPRDDGSWQGWLHTAQKLHRRLKRLNDENQGH